MLRRMVRRTSTRPVRFLMLRLRESRRLILRNTRNEIWSSAAVNYTVSVAAPGADRGEFQIAL